MHSEDIRLPLGIRHVYPIDAIKQVLDFYKGSNTLIGTKETHRRTHPEGDRHRLGPRLPGPLVEGGRYLLVALPPAAPPGCDDLTGEGVRPSGGTGPTRTEPGVRPRPLRRRAVR